MVRVKICSVQVFSYPAFFTFLKSVSDFVTLQGLHLPTLVEKACQAGSRLEHLHLEELNQPPDNTSLRDEDPIVCVSCEI